MQPAADSSLLRLASRPGGGPTSFTFFGGILLTFLVVGDIPTTAFEFDGGGGEHCSSSPPQSDTDIDCSSTKPASRRMAGDHAATSRSTLSNWRCNQPGLSRTSGGELAGIGADPFHRAFQAQLLLAHVDPAVDRRDRVLQAHLQRLEGTRQGLLPLVPDELGSLPRRQGETAGSQSDIRSKQRKDRRPSSPFARLEPTDSAGSQHRERRRYG